MSLFWRPNRFLHAVKAQTLEVLVPQCSWGCELMGEELEVDLVPRCSTIFCFWFGSLDVEDFSAATEP